MSVGKIAFPVYNTFKIALPVLADITKRSEIKLERESLETFFGYDHVDTGQDQINQLET